MRPDQLKYGTKKLLKPQSSETKPGSRLKATLPKQPKQKCRLETSERNKTKQNNITVKLCFQGNVDRQFCVRGFADLR